MIKTCKQCRQQFEITDSDLLFYKKISSVINGKTYDMPLPTLCPLCRQQRRFAFRNERTLYERKCDLCKKSMICCYAPNTPYTVYCIDCWWSDKWDPLDYGMNFDFAKPFFPQFDELMLKVPKAGMLQLNNENSDFNSLLAYSKNTYMSPGSYYMEDCYYVRKSQYCKDCYNCTTIDHCELVANSVNCGSCYNGNHLINCRNCTDCTWMADSIGCKNCLLCSGLINREYCILNEQYTKEEFKKKKLKISQQLPARLREEFLHFNATVPKKYQNQINCEKSSGDYIQNCKNAIDCYDCFDLEDCKYCVECVNGKDCMDLNMHDKDNELCYELSAGGESNKNLKFAYCTISSPYSEYLYTCFYLSNSFACDGFHAHQSHCIFNKKYSPSEYEKLKEKIIQHMIETKEYGEFFPIDLSTYPYNETVANDYYPMAEEKALENHYKWSTTAKTQKQMQTISLPDRVEDIPDTIVKELLVCKRCDRNYRIIAQELKLCKNMSIVPSPLCADCRYLDLLSFKNPRKLYSRSCMKCNKPILTTYVSNRPEIVYCEECYMKEMY